MPPISLRLISKTDALPLTLIVSLLLILSFSSSAAPLFWKAEKEHQQLFLMGTIHIGHAKLDQFSHDVIQALELADGLIVETKLDEKVHFPQDQQPSVEQILDDDTLSLLQQILRQSSLNQDSILRLPPWQVALTLQQLQFQSLNYHPQFGIDIQLSQWAQKHHMPIYGLESLQYQIDLLAYQPDNGLAMLNQTIREWSHSEMSIRCLLESWYQGDRDNLEAILEAEAFNDEFYHAFIYQRNEDWVKTLSQSKRYQSGTYFVAVGALHVVGQHSVIALLEKQGYTITLLSTPNTANCAISGN